jgi:hypothetical protein
LTKEGAKVKTLLPGLNSGIYNNPKKLYKGIFAVSHPKQKLSQSLNMSL